MMNWYDNSNLRMSYALSEDAGAPELRNPKYSAIRAKTPAGETVKALNLQAVHGFLGICSFFPFIIISVAGEQDDT